MKILLIHGVNVPLHDLRCIGPGPQSLPHVAVPVVKASQVHVGVDVLVVVVLLSRSDGLADHKLTRLVSQLMQAAASQ